jgi:NADH-quinone oxidoreductase subunit N
VTTFFATAPKAAALALTLRVTLTAFGLQSQAWQQVVVFIALASIVLGALGAIGQGNIKRLMAYSSINNVGFMLVGLALPRPAAPRRCWFIWRSTWSPRWWASWRS